MQDNFPPHDASSGPSHHAGDAQGLPDIIPVFPLDGVLLLPRSQLPLNIFEPRYLAMIEDALKTDRLIGMVQPSGQGGVPGAGQWSLYQTGCAGRITGFSETGDRRYLVTLTGLSRFRIRREAPMQKGYRRVEADWAPFAKDLELPRDIGLDRARLKKLLGPYFEKHGLSCDWGMIEHTPETKLINCLSMICPFNGCEKQALLEATDTQARADIFLAMLELNVHGEPDDPAPSRH